MTFSQNINNIKHLLTMKEHPWACTTSDPEIGSTSFSIACCIVKDHIQPKTQPQNRVMGSHRTILLQVHPYL